MAQPSGTYDPITGQWIEDPADDQPITQRVASQTDIGGSRTPRPTPESPAPTQSPQDANAQIAFYAALAGQTPENYLKTLQANGVQQAPTNVHEAQEGRAGDSAFSSAVNRTNVENSSLAAEQAKKSNAFLDQNLQPSIDRQNTANAGQITANRQAETDLGTGAAALKSALAQTQGQRTAGIAAANAQQSGNLGTYTNAMSQASAQQSQGNTAYANAMRQANAQQSQGNTAYANAMSQANAQQSRDVNTYAKQNDASNATQDDNNHFLQLQLNEQNAAGSQLVNTLTSQLKGLNAQDQAQYLEYMQKTNPMLAAQIAQASDGGLVQNQKDVLGEYKRLSNPEVTAQERMVAELARRKNENDDKSSRDATYAQLQGRGLNSGGQQIAAQLANRQATSSDRVLAELGLSASAQGRAMGALQGQAGVADALRNADDGMKQFQDQYAQQDALRRQGVAQGQANTGLATTAAATGRYGTQFDAGRANNNDATNRSTIGYNAATGTVDANAGRNTNTYNARTGTTDANAGRSTGIYNANTQTVDSNAGRSTGIYNANTQTVENNAGRSTGVYNAGTQTTNDNFGRNQYGYDTADRNAGVGYGTVKDQTGMSTTNRSNEANSAASAVGSAIGGAGAYNGITSSTTKAQQDALWSVLAGTALGNTKKPEDEN